MDVYSTIKTGEETADIVHLNLQLGSLKLFRIFLVSAVVSRESVFCFDQSAVTLPRRALVTPPSPLSYFLLLFFSFTVAWRVTVDTAWKWSS